MHRRSATIPTLVIGGIFRLLHAGFLSGQPVSTARIHGVVVDASAAAAPGVSIKLTRKDTQQNWTTVSKTDGSYMFTGLLAGPYDIEAGAGNGRRLIQSGIILQAGSDLQINLSLSSEQIPFSHKGHADLKIECAYCHEKALTGERAGFPAASKCMVCHAQVAKDAEAIVRLAALARDATVQPQKPVYRLPDFVTFSHARHKTEAVSCGTCHGNVWMSNVIVQQLPMRMKACIDCHKANHAAVACTTCHELFQ
jgi:hypothetical protein